MSIYKNVIGYKMYVIEILNAMFEWKETIANVLAKYARSVAIRIYVVFDRLSVFRSVSFSEGYLWIRQISTMELFHENS